MLLPPLEKLRHRHRPLQPRCRRDRWRRCRRRRCHFEHRPRELVHLWLVEWFSFNHLSWSMCLSNWTNKNVGCSCCMKHMLPTLVLNAVSTLHIILDIPHIFLSHGIGELFHKSSEFTWKLVQLVEVVLLVFAGAQIYHHCHRCFFVYYPVSIFVCCMTLLI